MASSTALELGTPVLLSNGHGWANVTRFAELSLARLADSRRRAKLQAASGLARCFRRLQDRQKLHGMLCLRHLATLEAVRCAKRQADDTLGKIRVMVDSFDLEADESVEAICRHVLEEDDEVFSLYLKQ
mmetsp:Transcript_9582/g.16738  ORF Transcript_9582/g.16738 Transcript_9582/m.16738 type:complete len:129 (+) Transcript_9582:34-420(+)